MVKIKRALISVSDKTGIIEFAKELSNFGVEIISTGGTAKLLKNSNIPVKEISQYTGFPEMLDGRVKTLHPKIHGGLLSLRDNPEHMRQIKEQNIELIDMVVVNLYPFEQTIKKPNVTLEEAIENIDIGGPSMLRSAAKNYHSVAVVCDMKDYPIIIQNLRQNNGAISDDILKKLGLKVFELTSYYDGKIYEYLSKQMLKGKIEEAFPKQINLSFNKVQDLRYGENPHQKAAFYKDQNAVWGIPLAKQFHGKELSFNNILDLNAAVDIVREFNEPAAVIIKHNNPCGAAVAKTLQKAFKDALDCDKLSAFGGIIGLNKSVDLDTAKAIQKSGFMECVIAPGYGKEALELLKEKSKNLRILELPFEGSSQEADIKKVSGGALIQDKDTKTIEEKDLKPVTKKKPTKKEIESLLFSWKVAKHVKSNSIVLAQGTKTVGIGAGQMSRVDSVLISIRKAGKKAKGSVLASDAFFPKEDAVKTAAKAKIKAIIQPGGSVADEQIIKEADKTKIAMVFTSIRHFKH